MPAPSSKRRRTSSSSADADAADADADAALPPAARWTGALSSADASRYARHVSLPSFGALKQAALHRARVLIVGLGGLGSPASMYLVSSGLGSVTLADADVVELSNIHRQIAHRESAVGLAKVASAAATPRALNSRCDVRTVEARLAPANALDLVRGHDVVLDCTDDVKTRYVVSDACAAAGVPLVAAAAVGTEGQLTVYCRASAKSVGGVAANTSEKETVAALPLDEEEEEVPPCYRCVFPTPPATRDCASCAGSGVLGPVPGVMGVLQATECIKVLTKHLGRGGGERTLAGRLLMYDAFGGGSMFTHVKLRKRRADCVACGAAGTSSGGAWMKTYDYDAFINGNNACAAVKKEAGEEEDGRELYARNLERITPTELREMLTTPTGRRLDVVDVRPRGLYDAAALPGARHVSEYVFPNLWCERPDVMNAAWDRKKPMIVFVCSRGIASKRAAEKYAREIYDEYTTLRDERRKGRTVYGEPELPENMVRILDVVGGMERWRADVDPTFPKLV